MVAILAIATTAVSEEIPTPDPLPGTPAVEPAPTPAPNPQPVVPTPRPTPAEPVVVRPKPVKPKPVKPNPVKPKPVKPAIVIVKPVKPKPVTPAKPVTATQPETTSATAPATTTTATTPSPTDQAASQAAEAIPMVEGTIERAVPAEADPLSGIANWRSRGNAILLVLILIAAAALVIRMVRARKQRVGWILLAFGLVYLAVVGGIVSAAMAAPGPPTGLVADDGDGEVTLTWQPLPAGTSIVIRRAADHPPLSCSDPAGAPLPLTGDAAEFVDGGLPNGVLQFYVACARQGGALSPPVQVSATPGTDPDRIPPAPPRGLQALDRRRYGVRVVWSVEDRSTTRVIVVRKGGSPPGSPSDGTVIFDGMRLGLVANDYPFGSQRVHYAAFAFDAAGNVSRPARASIPRFRGSLRTRFRPSTVTGTPRFSWEPYPGADYYNLQIFKTPCCGEKVVSIFARKLATRELRQALPPGRYSWFVFAHDPHAAGAAAFRLLGRSRFSVLSETT